MGGRWLVAAVVAGWCAALSGCAGDPSATAWAASVCQALAPWRTEIGALTQRAQEQMKAATTPAQAKENLVRMFSEASAASERARAAVTRAGVPDVDQGQAVALRFDRTLLRMRDAYDAARREIDGLNTAAADPFYDGVAVAVSTLRREYDAGAMLTARVESPELKEAFDTAPQCR
ncbi:hypothetical protein GCM10010124_11520 [Pilimelia terevasa]|uniref:Lipoprotein n=1 Tax=Pilimelia terevasa TaxID=53372 RepID=A0A8J3BGW0_9ACTN|nr:hypothetical protein [Pilimelia terevasa]GGK20661.1 hypothetical protein GCM10010124_11520 [Pilimelia terevasa]